MCLPSDFLPSQSVGATPASPGSFSGPLPGPLPGSLPAPRPGAPAGPLGRRRRPEEIARHELAVRALHADGLTDGRVAERLGLPVHAVAYLRRKLGLAPHVSAGDRGAVSYEPDEITEIVRLRDEECLSWPAIVRALGRGSPSSVELVYDRVAQGAGRTPTARDQARVRTCLACRKPFRSEWAGNRRCEPCAEVLRGAGPASVALADECGVAFRGALGAGGTWRQPARGQS